MVVSVSAYRQHAMGKVLSQVVCALIVNVNVLVPDGARVLDESDQAATVPTQPFVESPWVNEPQFSPMPAKSSSA